MPTLSFFVDNSGSILHLKVPQDVVQGIILQ